MGNDIRIKLRLTREPQTVDEVLDAAYSDKDVCRTASKKALPDIALRAFVDRLAYRILALESRAANPVAAQETKQAEPDCLLSRSVRSLGLPIRAVSAAYRCGAQTVGDLTNVTEAQLMSMRNFGDASLAAVKQRLGSLGLSLASPPPPLVAAPTASQPQSPTPRVFTAG